MAVLNAYNYQKPQNAKVNPMRKPQVGVRVQKNQFENQQEQYLETKVMTAKPEELTYMLYEGLVKFLKKAKYHIEAKNPSKAHESILRSQAIISELRATLNMDIEISKNLEDLYLFMLDELFKANVEKSTEKLDTVIDLAEDFRSTWKEAMPNMR